MRVEPLTGKVSFESRARKYWTFGDTIPGTLVLKSTSKRELHIKVAQGSIFCEEWVHTGNLEFKEHYRNSTSLLRQNCGALSLDNSEDLTIPFELIVPHASQIKYPPSFACKYNNIAWSAKFLIAYTPHDLDEYFTIRIERGFRVCTLPPKCLPRRSAEELAAERIDHVWSPQLSDFSVRSGKVEDPGIRLGDASVEKVPNLFSLKERLEKCGLSLELSLYKYGIPQSSSSLSIDMGMSMTASCNETDDFCILSVNTEIFEYVHTYGKDTQTLHKPVTMRACRHTLQRGLNNLNTFVEGLRICDLTEDFKTDWQQVTHNLKLTFECGFMDQEEVLSVAWVIRVPILSEAEFGAPLSIT